MILGNFTFGFSESARSCAVFVRTSIKSSLSWGKMVRGGGFEPPIRNHPSRMLEIKDF
jgi:hypothetical protein